MSSRLLGHLGEGESHRADHDHSQEEVVELEELWPPEVGDEEDGEDCFADGSWVLVGGLCAEAFGHVEELVDVEGDIDDDDE